MTNGSKDHGPFVFVQPSNMLNQIIVLSRVRLNRDDPLEVVSGHTSSGRIVHPAKVAGFRPKRLTVVRICLAFLNHQFVKPSLTGRCNDVGMPVRPVFTSPVDVERVAFDSQADARLSYPLPALWSAAELTVRRLTMKGLEPFPLQILDVPIVVDIPTRCR
jgi:hypothetical protein